MKSKASTVILIAVFLIGLSVLLYPTVSNYWNSIHQSRAIVDYTSMLDSISEEEKEEMLRTAEEYNSSLALLQFPLSEYGSVGGYFDILNPNGDGMIGYVTVDKLGIRLPIRHGTDESVLSTSAGHLAGSSFPVGGKSTHAVISAHRGLPSAKLFTDLDRMELGDIFTVTVLDRTLAYRVDRITTIAPEDTEKLAIEHGADRCTLLTCTPYGINTHRLLVSGIRTDADSADTSVTSNTFRLDALTAAPILAAGLTVLVLFAVKKPRVKSR